MFDISDEVHGVGPSVESEHAEDKESAVTEVVKINVIVLGVAQLDAGGTDHAFVMLVLEYGISIFTLYFVLEMAELWIWSRFIHRNG